MTKPYNLHHFESENKEILNIILNGFSDKSDWEFITWLFNHCKENNQSVISFDYEFQSLGQDKSSWPELEVEVSQLASIIEDYAWNYKKINFIAKSLWGIVLSKYLSKYALARDFTVKILWCIPDETRMGEYISKVSIAQWEYDRYWSPSEIENELRKKYTHHYETHLPVPILAIPWADHSYRNEDKTSFVWLDEIKQFILQ